MMLSRNNIFFIVLALSLALSGVSPQRASASVTIRNIPPTLHNAPVGTPIADLAAAIKMGVQDEPGWRVTGEAPGAIQAQLRIRSHEATVIIGFDESKYWINYLDSLNLDYTPNARRSTKTRCGVEGPRIHPNYHEWVRELRCGVEGPRIHRNYNQWVRELSQSIASRTRVSPKATPVDPVPFRSAISIADELEKLDSLRKRGVLTDEEFDQQKAKLLAR